jgi:putative oxidoreductase
MRPVRGLARALLGGLFIAAGSQTLLRPGRYVAQVEPFADQVAPLLKKIDDRIPTDAKTLVQINGAVHLGAGLLLATSTAPRAAAALLAATLVPVTAVGHPFWKIENRAVRQAEQVQFAKNLGLLAGLLLAAADTAGNPSLRWRAERAVKHAERSAERTVKQAERAVKQVKKKITPGND